MRALLAALLLLAACGPCPKPAAPAPSADPGAGAAGETIDPPASGGECLQYGLMGMAGVPISTTQRTHAAFEAASNEYGAALEIEGDHVAAAERFLACAVALRAVPDDDWQRDLADDQADTCYYNAMVSYANAGKFAELGRAKLEQAVVDDPRLADKLRGYLADPLADC